jgi:hypothetical protein
LTHILLLSALRILLPPVPLMTMYASSKG